MDAVNTQQTFAWAVKNPTIFVAGSNTNWSIQDTSANYMWHDKNVGANTDGKSIFDPSPIGWRLPIHGVWSDFSGNVSDLSDNIVTYTPASAIYSAVGYRNRTTSAITSVGSGSAYYTSTPSGTTRGYRMWASTSITIGADSRTQGMGIRAIRE